ncbi:MAG: sulfatase-like hydrolase/transferase [Micavibrio aeruginosavorus]|uniref:Sulfatase-like hydrolase/transferase n=1 Tax=Micavibrio aeruginosavorus TaxID=349221 RepID=A0A7T5R291_9BACT|nr:MAG: sulfatase-like hydrolase/transferase [Micavibrio aeruginosavorus]
MNSRPAAAIKPVDFLMPFIVMAGCLALDTTKERLGTYWSVGEFIYPFLAVMGLQSVLAGLLALTRMGTEKALALALFGTFAVFQHEKFLLQMDVPAALMAWTAFFLTGGALLFFVRPVRAVFIPAIKLYVTIFMVIYAVQAGLVVVKATYDLKVIPLRPDILKGARADLKTAPDIYFLLQDAYAGPQTLKRLYDYDNGPFINRLRGKGFYVAEDSRAYYSQTMLSVASTLSLNYIQDDIILPHARFMDRGPAIRHYLRPRLVEFLQAQGYDIKMQSTGYNLDIGHDHENDIRAPSFRLSALQVLISRSPLYPALDQAFGRERQFLNQHRDHYNAIKEQYGFLEEQAAGSGGERPRFVYAHILLPHPPFVFDSEGNFTNDSYRDQFYYKDGKHNVYDHLYEGGWTNYYRAAYAAQVSAANKLIESFVDKVLANRSGRPVVIVIQGDHGSRLLTNFSDARHTDMPEVFAVMNAVYVSDGDYRGFTSDISPLNAMRLIANKYFAANLPLLENRQWYSLWRTPYDFTDVTDRARKNP